MPVIPHSRQVQDYTFGPFRLEMRNGSLLLRGEPVSITPRALAVLHALVEQAGETVTKENLVQQVWAGAFIEESNITKNIAEVRRVLRAGYRGDADPIRTVWKLGYTFEAPVETVIAPTVAPVTSGPIAEPVATEPVKTAPAQPIAAPPEPASSVTATKRQFPLAAAAAILALIAVLVWSWRAGPLRMGGRQTVALLGIRNLSNNPDSSWMGAALTETLSSELQAAGRMRTVSSEDVARMRSDLGLGPETSFDRAALHRVRGNLGCDLAVTGTFLANGSVLRLDLRIEDAATGETRAVLSETGSSGNLLDLVSRAGADLRRTLGDPAPTQAAASRSTLNAEALRLYSVGLEHLHAWDAQGAQEPLTRATAAAPGYSPIHAALASDWLLLGFDGRAREEARLALDNASGLPREQQLQAQGRYAETAADWPKAIETWRALRTFYPDESEYTEHLANALTTSGKATEAIALLRSRKSRDARLLLAEATASLALSDFHSAVRAATDADAAAQRNSEQLLDSRALAARGSAYFGLSDFARAKADDDASRAISLAIGDRSGAARMLVESARVMRATSQGAAEPVVRQALEAARAIGDRTTTMQALVVLQGILRSQADMQGARVTQEECLAIARETSNANFEVQSLNNLGNLANNTGDQAGARRYYAASLDRAREVSDPRSQAVALGNIATLDFAEGNPRLALSQMQEALKIKRGVGDRSSIAYTLIYLGRVSTVTGDLSGARRYLEEADALMQSIHEKSVEPPIFLAQVSNAEGKPEDAEAAMTAMAPQFQKPNPAGNIWRTLAESRLQMGKVAAAREAADQAVAWGRKTPNRADFGIPCDLISARVEIAEKNYPAARKHLTALLAESRQLKHVVNELNVRLAIVELESRSGNLQAAADASRSLERDSAQRGFGLIASAAAGLTKKQVLAAR